ncbi:hypothetical protein [Primorskyibacter sp. 2E233]
MVLGALAAVKSSVAALGIGGLALLWVVKALIGWKLWKWLRVRRGAKI